ncbi:two-component sensor histidine kinase [Brachybacterium ginsengisoli]|uniref:Signal transduction histidine-protein kinase/phosphatase MprB n=1 Tax=Brachybacterium ginsengisoli TaxID=1331682 RepID=A0A291GVZ9_9MICO|nr:ATP-binding protein [Brachybacterium ginsengisoli]ATG54395.1 two-component sensor histidine kinase [Brachybacterium ginsengisoli]
MRQRVLQATVITVLLAVLMLGIPLGYSWLKLVEQNLSNQENSILDKVRVATETRLQEDGELDDALLQRFVDEQSDLNIAITVVHEGKTYTAGDPPGDDAMKKNTNGASGQSISVYIPQSDVRAHTASAWVLMTVAGLAALSIGISVALWQAQRISMPLARLSRRAEEIGSGRSRGPWDPSGISEIDDVAEELARSGAMLNERLEAESRLASDASHQLRTPLTALSMRLDEILAVSSEEWVREEARISLEQIDRLTEVVHDLINAPRSSQRRTPGVVELRSVLTQQSEEWSPAYRRAGRELRVLVPRTAAVWGSTGPLTQVVATLIENALAHGGGRTTVKVRRNDHSTVVEVTDEGGGIDAELGARIFERSVSGRSSSGTGVGLALARTLVEDDGGRLELLTESPATFGVFLISAPGDDGEDDHSEELHSGRPSRPGRENRSGRSGRPARGGRADMMASGVTGARTGRDDFDSLPQGSVVRRRPRTRD